MKFLTRLFSGDVPLMDFGHFSAMLALALSPEKISGQVQMAEHPYFKKIKESLKPSMEVRGGIAIIPIEGALAHSPDVFEMIMGVEDSRNVLEMVNAAAANPKIDGVLLKVNSPGGSVLGGFEIADAVKAADRQKPVISFVDGWGTSLAYLISSQASQIVSTRTAQVGSIGAVLQIADYTKLLEQRGISVKTFTNKEGTLKAIGFPGTTMTEEQTEFLQSRVDGAFAEMKKQIVAKRPDIPAEAMKGQSIFGAEGKKVGLVDRIGDMNFAMSVLRSEMRERKN